MLVFYLLSLISSPESYEALSVSGKRVLTESLPEEDSAFGSGYDAVTLNYAGELPVSFGSLTSTRKGPKKYQQGFVHHSFLMKHFPNREDLKQEFGDAEITSSQLLLGVTKAGLSKIVDSSTLSILDSFILVDIEVATDIRNIYGQVQLVNEAGELMQNGSYTTFIKRYGTHFLKKKVYGGKLMFLIKVQNLSLKQKEKVDEEMKSLMGSIGDDQEFRRRMRKIKELGHMELQLFTLGGSRYTGSLEMESVIDYALKFTGSVAHNEKVIEQEYLGMWTLLNTPRDFPNHIYQLQKHTDDILNILAEFRNLEKHIFDIGILRLSEKSWLSKEGWDELKNIYRTCKKKRRSIKSEIETGGIEKLRTIAESYADAHLPFREAMEEVLRKEKRYQPGDELILGISGTNLFITTHRNTYSRVSPYYPLVLHFENTGNTLSEASVSLKNQVVKIKSKKYPHLLMCMAKSSYYVFWLDEQSSYLPYCTWTLHHADDPRKHYLEYGDNFILSNVYWDSWILGISNDWQWVEAIEKDNGNQEQYTWTIDKPKYGPVKKT